MRLLVCFLFAITNISDNGRASLDSFVPTRDNVLFEDTTKNSDTSCYRPCKLNVKPKRCYFKFRIEPKNIDGKVALTINGLTPGPSIHVCANDVVAVEVVNKVPDQELAVHWHGIEQRGTPYMDGVPMITQCPIGFGSTYKYSFIASSPGTFFYHADSVLHQSDGIYGSLIVNQPTPLEPHASLYDYDRSAENTLLIGAKFPKLLTGNLEDISKIKLSEIVVNGDKNYKLFVLPGFAYKLRFINAIAIDCPVDVNIEDHDMIVTATDGRPVKPVDGKRIRLYPGERLDAVIRSSQPAGGYWIRVRGSGVCEGLAAASMFLYNGFNYTSMLDEKQVNADVESSYATAIYGQMLESLNEVKYYSEAKFIYLGVDRLQSQYKDVENDFRYISDAFEKKQFYPASLTLNTNGVITINNKSFLYPNSPLLLSPREVKADSICLVGEEDKMKDVECVHMLKAEEGETLELALVNEGFRSNESYTFHLHGLEMQVLATGHSPNNMPLSKEDFLRMYNEDEIERKQNPPLKDTVFVPNKGYTIVRIKLDHPGTWMLECRSCGVYALPTAVVINVPRVLPKVIVDSLPKCGNYRPPDVLLN